MWMRDIPLKFVVLFLKISHNFILEVCERIKYFPYKLKVTASSHYAISASYENEVSVYINIRKRKIELCFYE